MLLEHLHAAGVPVPRPRLFDDTGRFVDQQVAVLDHVDGAPNTSADDPVAVGREYARVLAVIHATEVDAGGTGVRPPPTQADVVADLLRSRMTGPSTPPSTKPASGPGSTTSGHRRRTDRTAPRRLLPRERDLASRPDRRR